MVIAQTPGPKKDNKKKKKTPWVHILYMNANLWLKIPKFGASKKIWLFDIWKISKIGT